jgi:energy-coupling factor transport system substrate-specific component
MAAVVAVMAALAALGRDAFAALPDVKPITAITLVVGYSLGPLPGFTVGAIGMLVSNFMLGQGPYTPWQMAAWGLVGLFGGALGRLSGRQLGRLPLALACGASALAAKEIMNLYTWTLGASHTPAALILIAGQGLPFDVTDTMASFLFGLAFAPELARVLARTRLRMNVEWAPPSSPAAPGAGHGAAPPPKRPRIGLRAGVPAALCGLAALTLLGAVLAGRLPSAGASAREARASRPASRSGVSASSSVAVDTSRELAFLKGAQNGDGGFGAAPGEASSEIYSAWAALGLAAIGRNPLSMRADGHTVLDAIRAEAPSLEGAGDLERTILALHACGVSVHSLPGGDPVARLLRLRGHDGSFGGLVNLTAFGLLALRAAGFPQGSADIRAAATWLQSRQDHDGGFGFAGAGPSDVDDTAAVLQALVAAGRPGTPPVARATAYLIRAQALDGGFPEQAGGSSNAQSTSWAVQGLIAAGRNPARVTHDGSRSPLAYLETLLTAQGSVRYSRTGTQTPVWVTSQALTALGGKPFPIAPVR